METTNIDGQSLEQHNDILNCSICLNPIINDNGVNISKTTCEHSFHTSCLLRVENCKCPICRACMHNHEPMIDENDENGENDENNIRSITNLLNNLINPDRLNRLIGRSRSNLRIPTPLVFDFDGDNLNLRTNIINERDELLRERDELMNEARDVVNEMRSVINETIDSDDDSDDDNIPELERAVNSTTLQEEEDDEEELIIVQREQELVDDDHEEYIINVLIDYDDGTQDIFNISKFKFIYNDSLDCIHRFCDNDDKCCRCIDAERTSHCRGCRSIDITIADEYGDEKVIEFIKYYIKVNEGVMKYIVL
jgi:hypothetical protein